MDFDLISLHITSQSPPAIPIHWAAELKGIVDYGVALET